MKTNYAVFLLSLLGQMGLAQVGKVGINTLAPQALLHVKDSSILFSGATSLPTAPGPTPVSGAGIRMMWYPGKAAFRSGYVQGDHWDALNIGKMSFAAGFNCRASGDYAVAFGQLAKASGIGSIAMGFDVEATGHYSISMGSQTDASGYKSISIGDQCLASGSFSVALGNNNVATGFAATAMGFSTEALDYTATAMGNATDATGFATTTMGSNTLASGDYSFASGFQTKATGLNSVATGYQTRAAGNYSTTHGVGNIANGYSSFVTGVYNDTIVAPENELTWTTPLFIIGNGWGTNLRSNALVVRHNGTMNVKSSLINVMIADFSSTGGFGEITVGNGTDKADLGAYEGGGYTGLLTAGDFHIRTSAQTRMFFKDSTGHVGIGTMSPAHRLDVSMSGSDKQIARFINAGGYGEIIVTNGTGIVDLGTAGSYAYVGTKNNADFDLRTGAQTRLTVSSNGHVGIGTIYPNERLDVVGNARVNGYIFTTELAGTSTRPVVVTSTGKLQAGTRDSVHCVFVNHPLPIASAPATIAEEQVALQPGSILIMFSGSAFRTSIGSMRLRISISLNGELIKMVDTDMTANQVLTHTTFPTVFDQAAIAVAGTYDIVVTLFSDAMYDGEVDFNDRINLTLIQQ